MMANDVNFETMTELLSPEKGWIETDHHCGEHVFQFHLSTRPHIIIKVYSSISKQSNKRRPKGKDAIRVVAVDLKRDKGLVKSLKVLRIPTWRKNLKEAIITVFSDISKRKNI